MNNLLNNNIIETHNKKYFSSHKRDLDIFKNFCLKNKLNYQGIKKKILKFKIALPSWGLGTGGTRFGRFPIDGDPLNIFQKIEDCSIVNKLVGSTSSISPNFPWDNVTDYVELKEYAKSFDLNFDLVNSNTFQDQEGQKFSYKFGSLTNNDIKIRERAIELNLECIRIGKILGSKGITVWIGDGSNFPGQANFSKSLDLYLKSMKKIYEKIPKDWKLLIEHKPYEPSFYSTTINDWGTSYICAKELGPKAKCLVDLGHHLPNTNIEMIVSRLIFLKKLGGFHFNDSNYGDDDLDTGSTNPYKLFLIFLELLDDRNEKDFFNLSFMIDQSHNVTDPIESLILSADEIMIAYTKALFVNKKKLQFFQNNNDPIGATLELKKAYNIDVKTFLRQVRIEKGCAIDPIYTYRKINYKKEISKIRKSVKKLSPGII